jgi:hypothetical protein
VFSPPAKKTNKRRTFRVFRSAQALGGKFYCKPHFRQLFARSGNYHG